MSVRTVRQFALRALPLGAFAEPERPGTVHDVRTIEADVWDLAAARGAWLVITTNGVIRKNGELVMGAGVAGEAARRHPKLAAELGALVAEHGNVPVAVPKDRILTWPTKPAEHTAGGTTHPGWMCAARVKDPDCVRQVARLVWHGAPKVVALADRLRIDGPIYSPAPRCGLGGLRWANVAPHLAGVLDDRFVIVTRP